MSKIRYFLMAILAIFSTALFATTETAKEENQIRIQLQKNQKGEWFVQYLLPQAVKQLVFLRSPNDARVKRWKSSSPDIEIVYESDFEVVRQKSGKAFSNVSFKLPATYTHLPKDYAPFMRFSNGGIAIYSGRYFVCLESCENDINSWSFTLKANDDDFVISDGKLTKGVASWQDQDSGQNVYVGPQSPMESSHFFGVIDPALPTAIVKPLNTSLPQLMDYFSQRLGEVESKPLVFASFEKDPDMENSGAQGGTLPNQVFMFWYGGDISERTSQPYFLESLLFFFGHEAAHFYQKGFSDNQDAWIHEGSAELMAYLALKEIMPDTHEFIEKKLDYAKKYCAEKRKQIRLEDATANGEFQMHYHCGMVLLKNLHDELLKKHPESDGIFLLWREYVKRSQISGSPSKIAFLASVSQLLGDEQSKTILEFLDEKENQ